MPIRIDLHDAMFGERPRPLCRWGEFSVSVFRYDSGHVLWRAHNRFEIYEHTGVDTITDFGVGDRIEFAEVATVGSSRWGADIADVFRTETTAEGTMLSYNHHAYGWADVVLLENVEVSIEDLIDGGQIDFSQYAI